MTDEVLRFPGMQRWGVLLCAGVPIVMVVLLWRDGARSPAQMVVPFVPFVVVWLLTARNHAREVVLTATGAIRVTTMLGRTEEAPLEQVRTRWMWIPGAAARELGLVLPSGRSVRVWQYPRSTTQRLSALLAPVGSGG